MTEADKLTCFMQGLRPKTRIELFIKKVVKLEDAILIASSIESVLGNSRQNEINYVGVKNIMAMTNTKMSNAINVARWATLHQTVVSNR